MSSLVSDFIINPVLRQARRFSEASRPEPGAGDDDEATAPPPPPQAQTQAAVIESDNEQDHDLTPPDHRAQHDAAMQPPSNTRPPSSSTENTRVEDSPAGPVVVDDTPRDHLGFPISPGRKGHGIPEDDGMRTMRGRIHDINSRSIPQSAKARLIHDALLERYRASRGAAQANDVDDLERLAETEHSTSPSAGTLDSLKFWQAQLDEVDPPESFILSESDKAPTFAPIRRSKGSSADIMATGATTPPDAVAPLGCQHYERNVKLQCSTCKRWYTCRFCHDAAEDHALIRKETKNMLCMLCTTPQRASELCIKCGEISAQYYCNICKLWENRQNKPIYHCGDCGICRRGLGLGKDFFHCKICSACIPTSIESSHKCIERSTDCDCPICGEYMFTSPKPVVFMTCGHSIHKKCYDQHIKVSYKCPICNKSLANMETQFRNLDMLIQGQPMPSEFRDTKALILCNDCSGKCTVPYHWLGLKCSICRSYNTVELRILGGDAAAIQAAATRDLTPSAATQTANTASTPAISQQREAPARPAPVTAISAAPPSTAEPTVIPNRRRHSSHGTELTHHISDRFARSLSPYIGTDMHFGNFGNLGPDSDSEDEMLGFWSNINGGDATHERGEESESDEDSQMSDVEEEDEEDEDEDEAENGIFLLGHR